MRVFLIASLSIAALMSVSSAEEVQKEDVAYGGWPRCIRLSNGTIELIATTDVGPRIIRFGFVGGQNLFKEYTEMLGKTGGDEWRIYGGHRLWHAPEVQPRTYWPDNYPVDAKWDGKTLTLTAPPETSNGVVKAIEVTMDPNKAEVRVLHRIENVGEWDIELAPWALTVMAQGGVAIYPQEPAGDHSANLLPARPMVLWAYTDMADPRWTWGTKYIQLRQDATVEGPQKFGVLNKCGWVAYALKGELFLKKYDVDPDARYPDYGCNTESYTNADMLEVETLGPLTTLAANGGQTKHTEVWSLHRVEVGTSDETIDAAVLPLVK